MNWDALEANELSAPHALEHRIAHNEGSQAAPFTPAPYLGDLGWLSDF